MNVFVYLTAVSGLGIALGWLLGNLTHRTKRRDAVVLYIGASIGLGFWLTFSFLELVGSVCAWARIAERNCVATDERTVWFLAVPLLVCPVYAGAMFVGRGLRQRREPRPKGTADASR